MDSEKRCLLELAPVEVWRLILANVSGTTGYHKIGASSKFFQTQISQLRLQILFPDVAQSLYNNLYKNADHSLNRVGYACSHLYNCRLVSRHWKQGIDNLFQNLPQHFPAKPGGDLQDFFSSIYYAYVKLEIRVNSSQVSNFCQYFEKTGHLSSGLNPFVFRSVSLACPQVDPDTALRYKELMDLLQIVGHHVRYCRVLVHGDRLELTSIDKLKQILNLLPNLKVLWMAGAFEAPLTADQILRTQQQIFHNPMPAFPRLQYVYSHYLPSSLHHNLWLQNPQLTMLDFRNAARCPIIGSVVPSQLQNLTHLAVRLDMEEQFEEFEYTTAKWPNLVSLDLDMQILNTVTWDRIFRFLETQFGSTVRHLRLIMPNTAAEDFCGQLKMLKLKTLRVLISTFVCLDFLLPSDVLLEDLTLFVNQIGPSNGKPRESKIKFFQYAVENQDLCRSNIWNYFPKLNVVRIQTTFGVEGRFQACTREKWVKKQEHFE